MKSTGFASKPPKSDEKMNAAQIKEMKKSAIYVAGYNKLKTLTEDGKYINAFKHLKKHPERSLGALSNLLSKFEGLVITEHLAPGFVPTKEQEDPAAKDINAVRVGKTPATSVTINVGDSQEKILEQIVMAYMKSDPLGDDAVKQVKDKADPLNPNF